MQSDRCWFDKDQYFGINKWVKIRPLFASDHDKIFQELIQILVKPEACCLIVV